MSLNKCIIQGRIVRDPELRHTNSGTATATLTLAVERDYKAQDGTKETDFIDVVTWSKTAEFASRFLSKGRMVIADGRLQIRNWQDKDGNRRRNAEVVADRLYFADSKRDEPRETAPETAPEFTELDDDELLPF